MLMSVSAVLNYEDSYLCCFAVLHSCIVIMAAQLTMNQAILN